MVRIESGSVGEWKSDGCPGLESRIGYSFQRNI